MSFAALAIGAGVALAKNELVDQPEAKRQRTLAAATQRYSPWTGLHAQPVTNPNVAGAMIQGAGTGAAMGQAMKLNDAQVAALNNGNNANTGTSINIGGSSNALGNYQFQNAFPQYGGGASY